MEVTNVLRMNAGNGEFSYANNSILQKIIIAKARPVLYSSIMNMCNSHLPDCLKIADLGCSSGPNTFTIITEILDAIHLLCLQKNQKTPQFDVCLNDLPGNDFNTIFKSLQSYYQKIKEEKGEKFGPCFVSGVPGSFYTRLFPDKNIHFINASNCICWLSQVPELLESNKENIYIGKTSPPQVSKAYLEQFQRDLTLFLKLRGEEIKEGGRMVLTVVGRSIVDPTCKDNRCIWELLSISLLDLVKEGQVKKEDLESFHLPIYYPYKDEVVSTIEKEGSFNLEKLELFEVNWDGNDLDEDKLPSANKYESAKNVAKTIRAASEPILSSHFGNSIIDNLFSKYAMHVAEHLALEKTKFFTMSISLSRKY